MNTDLDDELRKALRPVDPEEGFAERVMSRIESGPASTSARAPRARLPLLLRNWPAALAASVVLGVALVYGWHVERERRGLEARRQLLEALHITGEKLDVAYRGVRRESQPSPDNDAGA
jgi:hypothetical protein